MKVDWKLTPPNQGSPLNASIFPVPKGGAKGGSGAGLIVAGLIVTLFLGAVAFKIASGDYIIQPIPMPESPGSVS